MADQSISQLGVATALTGDELTVVVQNGVTKQTQLQDIADLGGPAGPVGPQGPTGPQGPGATIQVNSTVTGAPGTNASVTNVGSLQDALFNFVIPRGDTGATGATGATGPQGPGVAAGGTVGQVLIKASAVDYATAWLTLTGTGTVTSIDVSGGTTGLTFSGGPITTSGVITMAGTLDVANGGTGTTTLTGYIKGNGVAPFSASSTIPTTDLFGTISNLQLANSSITINGNSVSLGGSTTVTATATNALTIGTGLSGASYNGSTAVTVAIANTGVTAGTYGSDSRSITQVVNAQGQITSIYDQPIAIANTQVSGLGTASTLNAGVAGGVATLDGTGVVPISQLPSAVLGTLKYQGTWNAATNTPTLASGVGTQGYYYVVDVAGSTNLDGITDWKVGDWAIYSGIAWQKIDNTETVSSVNGFVGAVVLTTTNIAEGTNLYYTDTRARAALSAGTGISYAPLTGVITNSAPDQVVSITGAGTTAVTGTYPNFTVTSNDAYVGTVTSVSGTGTVSGISLSGAVTSSGSLTLGGTLDLSSPPTIGNVTPNTGKFTTFEATGDSVFSSTGALLISKGTTGQQPGTPVTGMLRYNTTTAQFEGYSGSSPAWLPVGGSTISNDTSTATNLYPVFVNATSGTATTVYTSNAKYLYKPSTGDLQASQVVAANGFFVNPNALTTSYTIPASSNASTVGPFTVASGLTVTVSSGSRWVVL